MVFGFCPCKCLNAFKALFLLAHIHHTQPLTWTYGKSSIIPDWWSKSLSVKTITLLAFVSLTCCNSSGKAVVSLLPTFCGLSETCSANQYRLYFNFFFLCKPSKIEMASLPFSISQNVSDPDKSKYTLISGISFLSRYTCPGINRSEFA